MKLSFPLLTLFPPIFGQFESNDLLDNQACDTQTMTVKIQFQRTYPFLFSEEMKAVNPYLMMVTSDIRKARHLCFPLDFKNIPEIRL